MYKEHTTTVFSFKLFPDHEIDLLKSLKSEKSRIYLLVSNEDHETPVGKRLKKENYFRIHVADKIYIQLTRRETEIMNLIVKGLPDKLIADELCIEVQTVKNHLKNIYKKMNVKNRVEATIKYCPTSPCAVTPSPAPPSDLPTPPVLH